MQNITLTISGMSCGHCLNAVNQAISTVQGVEIKSVKIGRADLRVPGDGAAEQVKAAIRRGGLQGRGLDRVSHTSRPLKGFRPPSSRLPG